MIKLLILIIFTVPSLAYSQFNFWHGMLPYKRDICLDVRPTCSSHLSAGCNTSGVYKISYSSTVYNVYCDQQTNGGGWMLFARSASGGGGSFGWNVASRGSVLDDSQPYIEAIARSIGFSEILMGSYSSGKTWYIAYKHSISSSFVASNTGNSAWVGYPTPIPTPAYNNTNTGFVMAIYAGITGLTNHFFFRDKAGYEPYGLYPSGWSTYYSNSAGGNIYGSPGMIMVR